MNLSSLLRSVQIYILYASLFLFPFFFLPITQDAFAFQKLYLIMSAITLIIAIGIVRVLFTQKITWYASFMSFLTFLIVFSSLASILISSPNKIQALFAIPSGLVSVFFLAVWSVVIIQLRPAKAWIVMKVSTFLLSLAVMVSFLFHISFSPLGNYLETGIYSGFFILYLLCELVQSRQVKRKILLSIVFLIVYSVACVISIQSVLQNKIISSLPSYGLSFDIARTTLTKPTTGVFGIGVDNYSALFTRAKTRSYNTLNFWNMNFAHGRSFLLDLWVETGMFGVALFVLFIIGVYYHCNKLTISICVTYTTLMLLLFPSSFTLLFLFFTVIGLIMEMRHTVGKKMRVGKHFAIVITGGLFSFFIMFFMSYMLIRAYRAEYQYYSGLISVRRNKTKEAYHHLQKAVRFNPYNESYRIRLAQFFFLIADENAKKDQKKLSKNDTHMIAQSIEFGLIHAKAVVRLNPDKAFNWENLGDMYSLIVGSVSGADAWAIASYQRAIQLDPISPRLRLKTGGIYYKVRSYEEAQKYFQQALELKPDWSNAHYNLAHLLFQEKKYQEALAELEKARSLLYQNSTEYQKITEELEDFIKKANR